MMMLSHAAPHLATLLVSVLVLGCGASQSSSFNPSKKPKSGVFSRYSDIDRVILDVDKPVMMSCELSADEIEAIQELFNEGWEDTHAQKWTVFGTIDVYNGSAKDEWSLMYTGEGDVAVTQFRGEHKYFRGFEWTKVSALFNEFSQTAVCGLSKR